MSVPFEDPITTCPIDKYHTVSKSKLYKHLVKCLKAKKITDKTICVYNPRHIIDIDEKEKHISECEDNPNIYISRAELSKEPNYSGVLPVNEAMDEVEKVLATLNETSQNEINYIDGSAYDPIKASIDRSLYRPQLIGGSKSEKKAFRKKEVQRRKALQTGRLNEEKCCSGESILHQDLTGISWTDIHIQKICKKNYIDAASDLIRKYDLF
ncbi:GSCOCG00006051001-RA-CDS [Cotesia congregata]|uniref:CHHC U11-48K-type domain-containing protein n=1 Tax=Cotesia congregata TaxID=51543 RepID=A0A8J2MG44_COTCN|nr:GSCOCG00006051001-RA-CDS [Cotesia congregata]CAG5079056.1 Protein of unknown function [Cotesia congregata]